MPVACPPLSRIEASPANYYPDRQGFSPEAVVVHIAEGSMAACDSWFANPAAQASAHFCVGKDGTVHQYCRLDQAPFANGAIEPGYTARLVDANGRANPNYWTVSIEHEGRSGDPVPKAQFDASTRLTAWLFQEVLFKSGASGVAVDRDHVLRHADISPSSRARCPGWSEAYLAGYIGRVQELLTQPQAQPQTDYRALHRAELRGMIAQAREDAARGAARAAEASAQLGTDGSSPRALYLADLRTIIAQAREDAIRAAIREENAATKLRNEGQQP